MKSKQILNSLIRHLGTQTTTLRDDNNTPTASAAGRFAPERSAFCDKIQKKFQSHQSQLMKHYQEERKSYSPAVTDADFSKNLLANFMGDSLCEPMTNCKSLMLDTQH